MKKRQTIKDKSIRRKEKLGAKLKGRCNGNNWNTGNGQGRIFNATNWSHILECPALESNCNECGVGKVTMREHAAKELTRTER